MKASYVLCEVEDKHQESDEEFIKVLDRYVQNLTIGLGFRLGCLLFLII